MQYTPADGECMATTSTGTQLLGDALRVSASLGTDLRNATVGLEADLEPGAPRARVGIYAPSDAISAAPSSGDPQVEHSIMRKAEVPTQALYPAVRTSGQEPYCRSISCFC